jgi:hypothetical protein
MPVITGCAGNKVGDDYQNHRTCWRAGDSVPLKKWYIFNKGETRMRRRQHAHAFVVLGATLLAGIIVALGVPPRVDASGPQTPSFAVDPDWPNPLPAPVGSDGVAHPWVLGEVGGTCVDASNNVYTNNRAWEIGVTVKGVLQGMESGAINSEDAIASAIPSPPIVAFSPDGNVVAGWGNPSLIQTGPAYGYAAYMPQGAHGCTVDYQGNIWIAGNGDAIVQKYNPAVAEAEGDKAKYVLQIGKKGDCDTTTSPLPKNPFTACSETTDANTSHTLLNLPADVAIDPAIGPISHERGDIYIADGYGNHRIVVFDRTGKYIGQWGTACTIKGVPSDSESCPPGTFGATGGGHPHCVHIGPDENVYACDRPDDRIEVFSRSCAVPSTSSNPQPVCLPIRIIDINNFNAASASNRAAVLLAGTRADDVGFWPHGTTRYLLDDDLGNDNVWVINNASKTIGSPPIVSALGVCGIAPCPGHNAGHFAFAHMVAVDSQNNIYVGETVTGRRIQKFVPLK